MTSANVPKNILLIEDNPSYQDLMEVAFEENQISHNLYIVSNAQEALEFLLHPASDGNKLRCDLIILDLNLPGMHGHELLNIIKRDDLLKLIPVVVFTSSTANDDILKCYNLNANCYLTKPFELEEFFEVVQKSLNFWLNCACSPQIDS
ncbi:MAG: response regulator [Pleurocapsa sp.]